MPCNLIPDLGDLAAHCAKTGVAVVTQLKLFDSQVGGGNNDLFSVGRIRAFDGRCQPTDFQAPAAHGLRRLGQIGLHALRQDMTGRTHREVDAIHAQVGDSVGKLGVGEVF